MNAQHTPGPWRIGDAGHTIFGAPNGTPSPKTIANLPFKNGGHDARLIAAAPDLLAAAKEAEGHLADWVQQVGGIIGDEADDALTAIRAAIAKAEGR